MERTGQPVDENFAGDTDLAGKEVAAPAVQIDIAQDDMNVRNHLAVAKDSFGDALKSYLASKYR